LQRKMTRATTRISGSHWQILHNAPTMLYVN
jgi:hypothetical protein